jgi:probable DNA repair protein
MPLTLTYAGLLDSLDRGDLVILPSSRAAHELRAAFDARQRARGLAAWEPAPALSWQQWTSGLWSDLVVNGAETRLLLNAAQEHSLWREIVSEDTSHRTLGSPDSLAELAHSAWSLAATFNATARLPKTLPGGGNPDSRIFSQWAAEFSQRCAERGLLSGALLDDALRVHTEGGTLSGPATLRLAGFDERTPAQESLLSALHRRGCTVEPIALTAALGTESRRASLIADSPREELELAARWVRGFLEEHRDAQPRVAILVPNLPAESAELDSVLREVLAPELQSVAADLSSAPWEISAATPLASLAMISDALDLAQWTRGPLPLERAGMLLRSPYLGHRSQRDALARFDAGILRRQSLLRPEIDIPYVLRLLTSRDPDAPALSACLQEVHTLAQRAASIRTATFAEWMEHIRALLAAAHWPAADSRALNAAEFEATRAWDGLLDLVSTLDFSGRRVPFDTALEALQLQAERSLFASPATHAPVQVMSIAEAEGCLFDAVVFLRATDANWPAPEHTHPLLPWPLQRSLAMPGTDATRSTQRARAFTASLLARSGSVLFTSAAADDNGTLRPSPLLTEFALTPLDPGSLESVTIFAASIEPETVADDTPLPPLADHHVRGGASVLQSQAACGFQAFAKFRLHSKELDTADLGFDAPESGSRLHSALQIFWKQVKTQDRLRAMPTQDRDRLLQEAIDQAMASHLHPRGAWDEAFIALQKQRLLTLLQQWMEAELLRGPFTVLDSEVQQHIPVGPLTLDVRLDRIDQVTGGFVLVDYKTGAAGHPQQWESERPDDPQLPLYALLNADDELKGFAFAKVRAGEMKWLGYEVEPGGILPASRVNNSVRLSAELLQNWHAVLTNLAHDFAGGRATVDPNNYPQTCEHCAQRILCRLDPASLSRAAESEDPSEARDE